MSKLNEILAVAAGALAILHAPVLAADFEAAACKALETTDLSRIQDAPTQIKAANVMKAADGVPAHCHIQGYVWPQVGIEMLLPTSIWNGKFLEVGCGGLCGITRLQGKLFGGLCNDALQRGYACIVSNQGHDSQGQNVESARSGLWAYSNLQAEIDYGFRAAHVAVLAGKAITQRFYGKAPRFSYFMGCSGGGRQALVEAQRFPWDFDGIIAGDPAINITGVMLTLIWNRVVTSDKNGKPLFSASDLDLLHNAVLGKCDEDDGLKDGVIDDPRACQFDPAELLCKTGRQSDCLSQTQISAARKVYNGPVNSRGEKLFAGGALFGAENAHYFLATLPLPTEFFRYLGFMPDAGPNWDTGDFDFDKDYKRLGMMESILADNNPDLRHFKARGGKLIITADLQSSGSPLPLNAIDYYETVERAMGGREVTQDFTRLFTLPGRDHCGGGAGANAFDFLSYLEAWVERGQAPDRVIGFHIEEGEDKSGADYWRKPKDLKKVKFTRPVYPYPLQAKYKGTGDPNDYHHFVAVDPASQGREGFHDERSNSSTPDSVVRKQLN